MFKWFEKRKQKQKEQQEVDRKVADEEASAEMAKKIAAEIGAAEKVFRDAMQLEKQEYTERGEPWVKVLGMDVDYEDVSSGNFELDWNDKFVADLMRVGFVGDNQSDIVDQWFTGVCRNIVMETYEQEQADAHPIKKTHLDDGRREYR